METGTRARTQSAGDDRLPAPGAQASQGGCYIPHP